MSKKKPEPTVEPWPVSQLDLDPENARLPEDLTDRSPLGLLRHFEEAYDLEELAWSMAEHGYFQEEPLLAVANPNDSKRRIVVEGNRRLATLMLLTDAEMREAIGKAKWTEMAELAADQPLEKVPVRIYPTKESLLDYLGFRHVSGLLPWTADAKARFVHLLVRQHHYSFERAGRVIGSDPGAIRRQFIAWRALEQGRAAAVDVTPAVGHFGVFTRALQNPAVRGFLDLTGWTDGDEQTLEPLGTAGTTKLEELLGFIFGKKRVLRESRDLDSLGRVLGNSTALTLLRETRDLGTALQELPASKEAVFAAVRLSYRHAARANAEAFQFRGDPELLAEVMKLRDMVQQILHSLEASDQAATG